MVNTIIGEKMIDAYKIKIIDDEERLFIYLNYNYEFASFNFKRSRDSIAKIIKEYIKKNNIIYKGSLVSIICGGMILGTVNLKNIDNDYKKYDYVASPNVVLNINELEIERPQVELKKIEDKKEINKDNIVKKTSSNNDIKKDERVNKKEEEVVVNSPKKEVKETDTNTYVKVKRNGGVVTIELEEYLIGVVGSEMPASFNIEALKSQAVVSRTYALKAINTGKTLTDDVKTQTYKDNNELKKIWGSSYDTYYKKIKNAVDSTKGQYLTYNGKIIDAVYHSTSNGKTEDSKNVWGNSIPYLVSVDSSFDNLNPSFEKTAFVSYTDLSNKLKLEINSDTTIKLVGVTVGDRVSYINILDKTFTGVEFRNILGLRSADFDIEKTDTGLNIITRGYGHGVGMSQYGANGMAKNGSNYIEILKHYYKGVEIKKDK